MIDSKCSLENWPNLVCKNNLDNHIASILSGLDDMASLSANTNLVDPQQCALVHIFGTDSELISDVVTMIGNADIKIEKHRSVPEQINRNAQSHPACCLLVGGTILKTELASIQKAISHVGPIPLVVLASESDVDACAGAFHCGVFDFLLTPVSPEKLRNSIRLAIQNDLANRQVQRERGRVSNCVAKLTHRERQVLYRLLLGKSMKNIASEFKISIQTAAKHRSAVLGKMEVENDVELVHQILGTNVCTLDAGKSGIVVNYRPTAPAAMFSHIQYRQHWPMTGISDYN